MAKERDVRSHTPYWKRKNISPAAIVLCVGFSLRAGFNFRAGFKLRAGCNPAGVGGMTDQHPMGTLVE